VAQRPVGVAWQPPELAVAARQPEEAAVQPPAGVARELAVAARQPEEAAVQPPAGVARELAVAARQPEEEVA